jgi:hypothetical protein
MDIKQLIDEITEAIMIDRGYDVSERDSDIEWDSDNEDSQFALILEDVEVMVDFLQQRNLLNRRKFS